MTDHVHEERIRAELAGIVNAKADSRLVDRLYAVVDRETADVRQAYENFIADRYEVEAL